MFAGKEDFKKQYKAEFMETIARPFEECTKREKYEVLAKMICSRKTCLLLFNGISVGETFR